MKANRKFIHGDDAVSPVIAVILMVAITVVLAATVYLFVSGFGNNQSNLVSASFAAKAVTLPNGLCTTNCPSLNTNSTDNAIQLTYSTGSSDVNSTAVSIVIDGLPLTAQTSGTAKNGFLAAPAGGTPAEYCTNVPTNGVAPFTWVRGSTLFLWGATSNVCGTISSISGTHLLQVSVSNQVVLDTSIQVHS